MKYVLLTEDERTLLVACPDAATAESVGAAAIFNDGGGVSAWLVPDTAVIEFERVKEILDEGGSISDIDAANLADAPVDIRPPMLRGFVDLQIARMLPQAEWDDIQGAPPRVIMHEYGAWVHVPPAEADSDPLDDEDWQDFPHLQQVLRAARELGADWINLDTDGHDVLPGLPTFDW